MNSTMHTGRDYLSKDVSPGAVVLGKSINSRGQTDLNYPALFIGIAVLISLALVLTSCGRNDPAPDADTIINRAIVAHGGDRYLNSEITFTFRGMQYTARRNGGLFSYERRFSDDRGNVHDVLNNDGFVRTINGIAEPLGEEDAGRYSRSVNSVIYFALLPYALNDPSVRKRYLGMEIVADRDYHKIEVTFEEEGGGRDFDDVFVYWICPDTYTMDYLAYEFFTGEGGIRFREAVNRREVGGILFADYRNYRPVGDDLTVYDTGLAFDEGLLEMISEVRLEDIQVTPYP